MAAQELEIGSRMVGEIFGPAYMWAHKSYEAAMAKVDGFNVFFSHRGAWTADLLAPGKEKEVIPVTWTKDWNRQAGTLFVWLKRSSDVERYMSLTEGFPVAIGRYNEHGGASAEDIVGIFFVVPLDASTEPIGIACKVIRRVKPTDARPTAGF